MLGDIVEILIKEKIGPGNCIADGWSCAGVHYFGIKHRWPSFDNKNNEIIVRSALLSCQPLLNEKSLDAHSQADSILATYGLYGDAEKLICCFTLDNTNTNPAMARLLEKPMIGAYCHRLNLACRVWMDEAFGGELMVSLETINAVMVRASTLKGRGSLRE